MDVVELCEQKKLIPYNSYLRVQSIFRPVLIERNPLNRTKIIVILYIQIEIDYYMFDLGLRIHVLPEFQWNELRNGSLHLNISRYSWVLVVLFCQSKFILVHCFTWELKLLKVPLIMDPG